MNLQEIKDLLNGDFNVFFGNILAHWLELSVGIGKEFAVFHQDHDEVFGDFVQVEYFLGLGELCSFEELIEPNFRSFGDIPELFELLIQVIVNLSFMGLEQNLGLEYVLHKDPPLLEEDLQQRQVAVPNHEIVVFADVHNDPPEQPPVLLN